MASHVYSGMEFSTCSITVMLKGVRFWNTRILCSDEGHLIFNRFLPIVLATILIDGTNDLKISNRREEGWVLAHRVRAVHLCREGMAV